MKTKKKKVLSKEAMLKISLWLCEYPSIQIAAQKCKLNYCTLYAIKKGHAPSIRTAKKLMTASYNHITLEDLGYKI
jgi:hypothetical protein